jgi:hypothetical protein
MDPVMLTILLTGVACVAITCVAAGVVQVKAKDAATRRALKLSKRIAIGKIRDGATVKICGRLAYAQVPLVAPLSGRRCAAWEVVVARKVTTETLRGGGGTRWEELISEQRSQDFTLDDGTGLALVKARSPMMALYRDACFRSGAGEAATSRLEAFLARHGRSSTSALGARYELVYHEGVLEEGEQVAVLGTARLEADPDSATMGYREPAVRVVVDEPDEDPLMLSDARAAVG